MVNFLLYNIAIPLKPTTVSQIISDTSVLLSWREPELLGDFLFVFYVIYCVTEGKYGTCPRQNRIMDYSNFNVTFSGLLPYIDYNFRLCAHNDVSFSNKAEDSNCEMVKLKTKEGGKCFL